MSVITVQPILRHLLDRMKANYVPPELYTDADILVMLNDGYLEACERTGCLRALTTITLVSSQQEYPLPADFSQMDFVASGGRELFAVSISEALINRQTSASPIAGAYYLYSGAIGFIPTPSQDTSGASTMIAYCAKPSPLLTYDDGLDARYPIEFADILLHYVVWRVESMSGGAESLRNAQTNRGLCDNRLKDLQRTIERVESLQPRRLSHVADHHLGAAL
jgi:hypothetical protein